VPANGGSCTPPRLPNKGMAKMDAVREVKNMSVIGGGGGGGGATYIFTVSVPKYQNLVSYIRFGKCPTRKDHLKKTPGSVT